MVCFVWPITFVLTKTKHKKKLTCKNGEITKYGYADIKTDLLIF